MKLLLSTLLFVFSYLNIQAQSLEEVTSTYNTAVTSANEEPAATLEKLTLLLPQAEALGAEGKEISDKIGNMLPTLQYNVAKLAHQNKDMKGAVSGFEKTIVLADQYGATTLKEQVLKQLPMMYYIQGNTAYKQGQEKEAMLNFQKALAHNESYAKAYYGISKIFRDKNPDSLSYYVQKATTLAGADTKEAKGYSNGTRIFLSKQAAKAAKSANHQQAIELYTSALQYTDAADTKNHDKYYYKLAKSYQALGKNKDACTYYNKVKGAKYLESAQYEITQKLKCN